jgi:hypothetical protein
MTAVNVDYCMNQTIPSRGTRLVRALAPTSPVTIDRNSRHPTSRYQRSGFPFPSR